MQQIKRMPKLIKEEGLPVFEQELLLHEQNSYPVKRAVSSFVDPNPLSYSELKEARALALLEYTALQQAFEQFSLRTADNLLMEKNEHLSSIMGLLGAEINATHRLLFSTEEKTEQLNQKEQNYLSSLIR